MIHFLVPRTQDFAMRDFLEGRGAAMAGRLSILHYEEIDRVRSLPRGTYIFSALDQLHPSGRDRVAGLSDQLRASGMRVLNHPRDTLLRFDLLATLHREGLNRHRAFRAGGLPADLRYPVFIREEQGHTGALSGLLRTRREVDQALGLARAQGHRLQDLLVVEFCDTSDQEGYFRKYAAFVVGSHIIARGLAWGRRWMLKSRGSEYTEAMLAEELAFLQANPHEAELRRIARVAGVEYGRIDYGLREGRVETWEINLNPTIGRGRGTSRLLPPELSELREPARHLWSAGILRALEEMDTGGPDEGGVLLLRPVEGSREPMVREVNPAARRRLLRTLLRPLKPVLLPVIRALSPILARLGR